MTHTPCVNRHYFRYDFHSTRELIAVVIAARTSGSPFGVGRYCTRDPQDTVFGLDSVDPTE